MSKASEWAKLAPPEFKFSDKSTVATVTRGGQLFIEGRPFTLTEPEEALRFARWLVDTFDDGHPR